MSKLQALTLYRSIRITLALVLAIAIWLLFDLERGYWIAMTLMLIYMPFEPGAVSNRIGFRLKGTIVGLLLGFLLVALLSVNSVFLLGIPLIVLLALYFSLSNYYYATVFITMGVMVVFANLETRGMSAASFMFARLIDTFIACIICLSAEFLFKPKRLIALSMASTLEAIFKSYAGHYLLMEKAFKQNEYHQISLEQAARFNAGLLTLQQQLDLNKTKLPQEKQRELEACLPPIFKLRTHFGAIQYLARQYPEKAGRFYGRFHQKIHSIGEYLEGICRLEKTDVSKDQITATQRPAPVPVFEDEYEKTVFENFNKIIHHAREFHQAYHTYRQLCGKSNES